MLAASALPAQREIGAWGLHANAYGVYSNLDGGSQHVGYDAATGVFGLGADSWLSERVVAGVDLSAAYTHIDSDRSGTDINGVTGRLSGYTSFDAGPAYVDALASYAYHWFDADRRIEYGSIDRRAKSDHGAHEGSGLLAAGLEFSRAGFEFGPEASAQYTILYEESYHESSAGAAGLRFDDRDPDSLGSRLGIRVSRPWRIDPDTLIAPRLRVAWAHEWLDTDDDLSVAFPDTSFGAFEVSSRKLSRDSVLARIGVQALLGDDIVVEAAYGVDIGRSETMSQQLGISLRAAF
jgi:outer membrane autotransporter protein